MFTFLRFVVGSIVRMSLVMIALFAAVELYPVSGSEEPSWRPAVPTASIDLSSTEVRSILALSLRTISDSLSTAATTVEGE